MSRRPSFTGLVRGELLKSSRQATTWLFLLVMFGGIGFSMLAMLGAGNIKTEWQHVPTETRQSTPEERQAIELRRFARRRRRWRWRWTRRRTRRWLILRLEHRREAP